jgi:hypothetical protein
MKEKIATITAAKEDLLNTIINDPDLSKHEKLNAIQENNLYPVHSWVQHPFKKYEDQFKQQIGEQSYYRFDELIHEYAARHQTIDIAAVIEGYIEEVEYTKEEDEDFSEMVIILSERASGQEFKVPLTELIDHLYDWAIEHKCVEYTFDW